MEGAPAVEESSRDGGWKERQALLPSRAQRPEGADAPRPLMSCVQMYSGRCLCDDIGMHLMWAVREDMNK